ncbi:MAG: succinyl-diaminopimelate desuccinylase [Bdellovibrionales bacterium]|jgi:succinyl-diaminopimelate desuccinylase|nr:succinyl-diaminopimelate desuccinylase [Bdellovibrionales bacterium]
MPHNHPHHNIDAAGDATVKLARELVKIPSITAVNPVDKPASARSIDAIADYAAKSGARVERMEYSGGHHKWDYPVENVYLEWTFGKTEANQAQPPKHICYIGHLDVVPVGDEAKWTTGPFEGEIKDGYLYGRGVTDMKGSVAAFITAVEDVMQNLNTQNTPVRVSMILTTDEEWAAVNGTKKVLEWLKQEGQSPDAFIVGEPSSQDDLGSHIKIGRRGSLVGTFNVAGVQGHAAYQELFENPNRALALAVAILSSKEWKDGNANFPNTNFETVALKSGDFGASAVIPGKAEALWNIRFTPSQTPDSLEAWIKDALANPPAWAQAHPDADKLKNITVTANKDTASQPYYSEPAGLAQSAKDAVKTVLGMDAKLDGSGGTTDGRFVSNYFPQAEIIELGLPERGGVVCKHHKPEDYLSKGGMHQVDERAAVADLVNLRHIFKQTIVNYAANENNPAAAEKGARTHDAKHHFAPRHGK